MSLISFFDMQKLISVSLRSNKLLLPSACSFWACVKMFLQWALARTNTQLKLWVYNYVSTNYVWTNSVGKGSLFKMPTNSVSANSVNKICQRIMCQRIMCQPIMCQQIMCQHILCEQTLSTNYVNTLCTLPPRPKLCIMIFLWSLSVTDQIARTSSDD